MRIIVNDPAERKRNYKLCEHFDGTKPLRELIIQALAKCPLKCPFYLAFEEDELAKIKELLHHFFKSPFSPNGLNDPNGTVYDFFQHFLLADFVASNFVVAPLLKGYLVERNVIHELTIYCVGWHNMIVHAKMRLAERLQETGRHPNAVMNCILKIVREDNAEEKRKKKRKKEKNEL